MPRNKMLSTGLLCVCVVAIAGLVPGGAAAGGESVQVGAPDGTVTLVSVRSDGQRASSPARLPHSKPVLSRKGRFVVFQSRDPDMTAVEDTNNAEDVYVRDRVANTTRLISRADRQAVSGGDGSISANGRYVAFLSDSPALVHDDSNGDHLDVFVRDLQTGDVTLVSTATDGTQRKTDVSAAVISGNGRRVAFLTTARLSPADDDKAPADQPYNRLDVYVHSLATGHTRLVSVDRNGENFTGPVGLGGISNDGRLVGFTWGNAGRHPRDVPGGFYVHNLEKRGSTLIWRENINALGLVTGAAPALSGDGRFAAFASDRDRIDPEPGYRKLDIVRMNVRTGHRSLVSVGRGADANADSDSPTLSYRGRYVAFRSDATNLVVGDDNETGDAFRFDVARHVMSLVSVAADGSSGNSTSAQGGGVAISADGQHVAFHSYASDLTATDATEGDVFLWTAASSG